MGLETEAISVARHSRADEESRLREKAEKETHVKKDGDEATAAHLE